MKFEDSTYFNLLNHKLIELPFGRYFLLDEFIIAEINQEIHLDWKKIEMIISKLINHYGEEINIAYISNRVNSYSFEPNSWIKFEKEYGFVFATAIVYYDQMNAYNATLEKHLVQNSLKRCRSLDEAIHWVLNLKEIKDNPFKKKCS